MILRFSKDLTPAMRDEKFREFCDMTSQALGFSIEMAKPKDVAGPGDFVMTGTHTDTTLELDLDDEEPIALDGFECVFVPRADADIRELKQNAEWMKRFSAKSVDRAYAGTRVNEFIMEGGNSSDTYHFVIKVFGA